MKHLVFFISLSLACATLTCTANNPPDTLLVDSTTLVSFSPSVDHNPFCFLWYVGSGLSVGWAMLGLYHYSISPYFFREILLVFGLPGAILGIAFLVAGIKCYKSMYYKIPRSS